MKHAIRLGALLVVALAIVTAASSWYPATVRLPESLTDREFWALSESLSEPPGYFQSDNLVSNEHTYQWVVPELQRRRAAGQVYLGVAPDQNFTYVLATQPAMAFIVDIRRGNLLTHLMYKALFETAADRVAFVSMLFSRPRPEGLDSAASIDVVMDAFARVPMDELAFRDNVVWLQHYLTREKGYPLNADDLRELDRIYEQFAQFGPGLTYASRPGPAGPPGQPRVFGRGGFGGGGGGRRGSVRFPTWDFMVRAGDEGGRAWGYLASEEAYQSIRQMQIRNLIVPVMGDFTGPKALRAVGGWVRQHGAAVSAFYVSNVEQYLFRYGTWSRFAENLASLPVTEQSVIIRSVSPRDGYGGRPQGPDGRASVLDPIGALLRETFAGKIRTYGNLTMRGLQP
jgi:hypothetical protein